MVVLGILSLAWVYTSLFPYKSKEVTYWPQIEVLAVPGPGAQLLNLSRWHGELCGNLAVHKQGNNLPPMLELLHCCCYGGFRLQSHSVGSQQASVCCWHVRFKADPSCALGLRFCHCMGRVNLTPYWFCATMIKHELGYSKIASSLLPYSVVRFWYPQ